MPIFPSSQGDFEHGNEGSLVNAKDEPKIQNLHWPRAASREKRFYASPVVCVGTKRRAAMRRGAEGSIDGWESISPAGTSSRAGNQV